MNIVGRVPELASGRGGAGGDGFNAERAGDGFNAELAEKDSNAELAERIDRSAFETVLGDLRAVPQMAPTTERREFSHGDLDVDMILAPVDVPVLDASHIESSGR